MQKYQVAIVEDDADISSLLITILKFSGIEAVRCENPDELESFLQKHQTKVLLSDMLLDEYDGRELCKKLKQDPRFDDLKILMMSAHPDGEETCKACGADDFISKPFDMDDIVNRINALLQTYA